MWKTNLGRFSISKNTDITETFPQTYTCKTQHTHLSSKGDMIKISIYYFLSTISVLSFSNCVWCTIYATYIIRSKGCQSINKAESKT